MGKPTFDNWNFEAGGFGVFFGTSGFGFPVIKRRYLALNT
jgi:hypothetical protein